jgi:hypothetical protein
MPHKRTNKPREAERDYSHRTLLEKLGVKPGQKILIVGVDDPSFLHDIQPFSPGFAERKPAADLEMIFFWSGAEKRSRAACVIAQSDRQQRRYLGRLSQGPQGHS